MNRRSLTTPRRQVLLVAAALGVVLALLLLGPLVATPPAVEDSTYGYGVTLDTNTTLRNVTLSLPLPVSGNDTSPVAAAIRSGAADAPEGWQYDVVETERGLVVRIEAETVPAERQPDGNRSSAYRFGVTVPADHVIDTGNPYGTEPTVAPVDGRRERPCPNQAAPDPRQTCFDFDTQVYVSYDAPPDADVGVRLVHNGVNSFEPPRNDIEMYYERFYVGLRGPQDSWLGVDGFATVEEAS